MHGDLNQKVAALAIGLDALTRRVPDSDGIKNELTRLYKLAAGLATRIRRVSNELHPAVLEHAGLTAALEAHCAELRANGTPEVDVDLDLAVPLDDVSSDVALCVYRVVQELVANALRHGSCRRIKIAGRVEDESTLLMISDDGVGFELAAARRSSGLGLRSAQERLRVLGGTIEIESRPGAGTTVTVRLPLNGLMRM